MIPHLRPINIPPNILIVGAGGIGCELVKSLAVAGHSKMTVLDFDTVSLSNLSRQFFYSEKDIGIEKSKALASNASILYPDLDITGIFMDVSGPEFSLPFIMNFDFVFCAVDNIAARRKVNQLCVFSQTMAIDCASSGKFGQSVPVFPYRSGCYDCNPVSEPSGPKITCTIRSTPESYEHCAAWAFHLFNSMFIASQTASTQNENDTNGSNASKDVIVVESGSTPFKAVFIDRIKELRQNHEMWKHRNPPEIVDIQYTPSAEPLSRPRDIWTDVESAAVFSYLADELNSMQKDPSKSFTSFDKDNPLHLAFSTAAANLQARAFSIEKRSSMFDAKGLVSVVEPALATTNSTISGIAVIQMERMLSMFQFDENDSLYHFLYNDEDPRTSLKSIKSVWMSHDSNGPRLTSVTLDRLNPNCSVCGAELFYVDCDFETTKLGKIGLSVDTTAPSIVKNGKIIFDAEDLETDEIENSGKTLQEAGICNGDIMLVTDLDASDEEIKVVVVKESDAFAVNQLRSVVKQQAKSNSDDSSEYSDIIEIK